MSVSFLNPKVSIITVCLNSRNHLETAIKSVLSQTYKNIEYIVVDGGSADGTLDIIKKYEDSIHSWSSGKDKSVFDAMNKGIEKTTGDILYFLNSDDYLINNNVVEKAVEFFREKKDADLIYGDILYYNHKTKRQWPKRYPRKISKRHFLLDSIPHPATFFRSRCFKKAGCFNPDLKIAGDFEWFLRALYKYKLHSSYMGFTVCVFQLGGLSSNFNHAKKHLEEVKDAQRPYFSSIEIFFVHTLNFFLSGEIFRRIILFTTGRRMYSYLKDRKNRFTLLITKRAT